MIRIGNSLKKVLIYFLGGKAYSYKLKLFQSKVTVNSFYPFTRFFKFMNSSNFFLKCSLRDNIYVSLEYQDQSLFHHNRGHW